MIDSAGRFDEDDWTELPLGEALALMDMQRRGLPRHGPGLSTAIVVVDMQLHFLDDPASAAAVGANAKLLAEARDRGVPIFLAKMGFETEAEVSHAWRRAGRAEALIGRDPPAADFHPGLGLDGSEPVVPKHHASAFAGTDLDARLKNLGVDTILLTGTSTSGCVRATAVDGSALLYRVLVIEEAVHDPRQISGAVALFDIASRYADMISLAEALDILKGTPLQARTGA